MRLKDMTRKTKEIHAEFLLKVSSNLFSAFYVMLLVAPIGAMLSSGLNQNGISTGFSEFLSSVFLGWRATVFVTLEFAALGMALWYRTLAFKIYNELYPDDA